MHINKGELQSYLDDELSPTARDRAEAHLQGCQSCQAELQSLSIDAENIRHSLVALDPPASETPISPQAAFIRLQTRAANSDKEIQPMWQKLTRRSLRPLWAGLAVLVVLAGLLFIPQVRATAENFLGLFRVQNIQVLQFNPANLPQDLDQRMMKFDDLMSQQLKQEGFGDAVEVNSAAEASQMAGFDVLGPSDYTGQVKLTYQPAGTMELTIDVPLMQLVLQEVGSDLVLPNSIDGQKVTVEISNSVTTLLGNCPTQQASSESDRNLGNLTGCISLVQMPSPTVNVPPGIDVEQMGQSMLELLGFSPQEAADFSSKVDWTSTLILPVPTNLTASDVNVQGVPATLLVEKQSNPSAQRFTLLWIKDGILFGMTGRGNVQGALSLADSLQ
jgi:hypothetical protein